MINTFSNITIRATIATGLVFTALGSCVFNQSASSFTQSSHARSELGARSTLGQSLGWTIAPSTAKFSPEPNPEPISTGGTGTR